LPQDVRKIATLRQDARDAEYPALASGRNAGGSDARSVFADATPAPETFTRAESTPPPPTPSHSATTSPAPTPRVPHYTRNPHPPQKIAAGGSRDTRPANVTNMAHRPSPEPHNKPEPPTHTAPRRGRGRRGRHRT